MDNGVASAPCTGTQRYIQPWKARITGFFTLLPEGVGANLFAKTVFQTIDFQRLYRPFREQVRSYRLRPESKQTCI
jgi:hypothetical protein